jgi:tetratricopeptide (TPR) repeat protein
MRLFANWHNARGNSAHARGEFARAVSLYEKAIASDHTLSAPWYNLGLIYKERHDWKASLRCDQEAVRRNSSSEAAWWNLGIAATALSEWTEARRAWSAYGLELPEGTGEIVGDFGYTPIRINPHDDGEVVWTDRIDPARAIIRSVPLPESGHRYGDLLLHDGAPNGYRMLQGREVPVFNELEVLSRSPLGTYSESPPHRRKQRLGLCSPGRLNGRPVR